MKTKRIITILLLITILVLSGCNSKKLNTDQTIDTGNVNSITDKTENSIIESIPNTNDELFEYVILKWKQRKVEDLYDYADSELTNLLNKNDFAYLFDSVSKIGGELKSFSDKHSNVSEEIVTYNAKLDFENITAEVSLSFRNSKICAFTRNIFFKNTFEINRDNGVTEKYFVLENDGYKLNAVYTYINDGKSHPAALLIAGSGQSDYNETIGLLTPFEDIALGLAQNGINSLRVDKRTFNYAADLDITCGIKEEYLDDCNAAVEFLKEQSISGLYLLGHSLGGQIATELAASNGGVDGIIIFNSTARHLADIICDQYAALDPTDKESYITYADAAKSVSDTIAKGYCYYGVNDYYWASYNQLNVTNNISESNIKTLIINSTFDKQTFDADIDLWAALFSDSENVSICVFDDISHFGYKIDTADPSSILTYADFPNEVISLFADFIKGN